MKSESGQSNRIETIIGFRLPKTDCYLHIYALMIPGLECSREKYRPRSDAHSFSPLASKFGLAAVLTGILTPFGQCGNLKRERGWMSRRYLGRPKNAEPI